MAGWSDPQLTKIWSMPTCARVCKKREDVVSTMMGTTREVVRAAMSVHGYLLSSNSVITNRLSLKPNIKGFKVID